MMHSPPHPGEFLAENLEELGISVSKAASDLGVSRQVISGIVNGHRPITPDMAVRIGRYIGNGPGLWLRMQASFDLWQSQERLADEVEDIPIAACGGGRQ